MEYNIRKSECGVYIIADLHFQHKNIMKYQENRKPFVEKYMEENGIDDEMTAHDKMLIDLWLKTTKRGDVVYVVGDFIMGNQKTAIKILNKLKSNGCKIHLIVGNHDKSIRTMHNMFESIELIKVVPFSKKCFSFLEEETFQCVFCHYGMKSWPHKCKGSAMIHGHTHDNSLWENDGFDLSFNVGFDAELSNMGLIPLEEIYCAYKKKLNGMTPKKYIDFATKEDPKFIR